MEIQRNGGKHRRSGEMVVNGCQNSKGNGAVMLPADVNYLSPQINYDGDYWSWDFDVYDWKFQDYMFEDQIDDSIEVK